MKISKRKISYFGTDKKKTLEKYLAQATYLHGAQSQVQNADSVLKPTSNVNI